MGNLDRRTFIKQSSIITLGAPLFHVASSEGVSSNVSKNAKRELIFGWTTCLTYETNDRKLGFDYFSNMLDEMHAHGMFHLIVMMASHGYFSPLNHGLAWPAKNEKLKYQIDKQAVNACEETEFFTRIIKKAHALNIKVYIGWMLIYRPSFEEIRRIITNASNGA
jgi:hypothetical protein